MESNDDHVQFNVNSDKILEDDDDVDFRNNSIDSEDDDDDSFFNQLFTSTNSAYVATDTVPWLDDSDSEIGASEFIIKFYIDSSKSVPLAQYNDTKYRIGFLDLTKDEFSCLGVLAETSVELSVNEKHIFIYNDKFNIKRITERQSASNEVDHDELLFKRLNLVRIQFSTTEPFMAKYNENVYFVGQKLCDEYAILLHRTKKRTGTAIRIRENRLKVDKQNQILDINRIHTFKNQNEFCIISGSTKRRSNKSLNDCRRFMIWNNSCILLEVDIQLTNASIHDSCVEIYAETDFPFISSERITSHAESKHIPIRKTLMEEKMMEQNEREKNDKQIKKEKKKKNKKDEKELKNGETESLTVASIETKIKSEIVPSEFKSEIVPSEIKSEIAPSENKSEPFKMIDLDSYVLNEEKRCIFTTLSKSDRKCLNPDTWTELSISYKEKRIRTMMERQSTYLNQQKVMLFMEEIEYANYLKTFDEKTTIQLTHYKDRQFGFPINDEICELVAQINNDLIGHVILQPDNSDMKVLSARMSGIREQQIIIGFNKRIVKSLEKAIENTRFAISFKLNRLFYKMQHYTWDLVKEYELFIRLIDNSSYRCKAPEIILEKNVQKCDENIFLELLNSEQRAAVDNFCVRKGIEPYILIGGPGTGKTFTIISIVEHIIRTTKKNILLCTPSTVSCDKITERLLAILRKDELYRFYGQSCRYVQMNPMNQEISNTLSGELFYPSLEFLYKFRVIICTTIGAGFLARARTDHAWSFNHFDYVIIDDCGSIPISMNLIPIAGVCSTQRKVHAKILLAGDSKQLNNKTRSNMAREMGRNRSLIEVLCESNLYSRSDETGQFNNMYITKLIKNYRTHPAIVNVPNELFYENELETVAKKDVNWFVNTKFLPTKEFPLIFKSIHGKCHHHSDHDYFNDAEIEEVIRTIEQLLQLTDSCSKNIQITESVIGVITPYHIQCRKILHKLHALNFHEITVGTADDFLGIEKQIIIVSTVRTDNNVDNIATPNWMNFVLNRAQSLILIIGHSEILKEDANWNRLIEYCMQNSSFI